MEDELKWLATFLPILATSIMLIFQYDIVSEKKKKQIKNILKKILLKTGLVREVRRMKRIDEFRE